MSTKKKTKTTTSKTTTKRSDFWKQSFAAAIVGATSEAMAGISNSTSIGDEYEADVTQEAAKAVRLAEKIATIADARNA